MTAAVYILILFELGVSIASTIYGCQAFCDCCRCCIGCEDRCCGSCGDCDCDYTGTFGYDQYNQPYVVPYQSIQQPPSRVPGGYVRFGNQPFGSNPASLVNIYISIPGQTPMPVTTTASGATQVIIQDQRTAQPTESQQQTETAEALSQHTEPQAMSTAPPSYHPAYGYEMQSYQAAGISHPTPTQHESIIKN